MAYPATPPNARTILRAISVLRASFTARQLRTRWIALSMFGAIKL
jgi:hypothetical protein